MNARPVLSGAIGYCNAVTVTYRPPGTVLPEAHTQYLFRYLYLGLRIPGSAAATDAFVVMHDSLYALTRPVVRAQSDPTSRETTMETWRRL